MTQTATWVSESLLFRNALHYINTWKEVEPSNEVDGVSNIKVGVRQHPHYLIRFFNGVGIEAIEMVAVSPKDTMSLPMGHLGLIHPLLTEALRNVFGSESPLHGIKIYKDAKISVNGGIQQIRAFANYDKDGSFFDWVTVTWRLGRNRNSSSQTPAKVLLIYEDKEDEISVLVQSCFWQNKEDITSSTDISGRWRLEINNETADERKRVIRSVKLKDITDINYVVQHFGNPNELFGLAAEALSVENAFVDVMEPRYAWACQFLK